MAPPQHVKIISGTASAALLVIGLRNLVAPHKPIPFLKTDHDLFSFFWGTKKSQELVPGQVAFSKTQGMQVMTLALAKLTMLFSTCEGTFLRRDLFAVIGGCQLAGALVLGVGDSQKKAKDAGASFLPTCFVLALEGLVLLHDAFFRDRPVKK